MNSLKAVLLVIFVLLVPTAGAADRAVHRIGFIVPFSGPLAEFGYAIRNGVLLAAEDNPEILEVIQPVYEDSRYDSKTSVANFQKLLRVDRVSAVYVFGGPMSDTLAPIAERNRVPMFSTEYDVRYTRGKRYVIRFANNAADYAEALLTDLRERGLRHFGLIKVENQYHNTLSDALLNSLREGESAELVYNFQPEERDFRTAAARLRAGNFDALGIYLTPGMQHSFLSQLRSYNVKFHLFGSDSFESARENKGLEDLVEGARFANSAVSQEFSGRYIKRFGSDSQIVHAALAYEFARLAGSSLAGMPAAIAADEFVRSFAFQGSRSSVCGDYYYRNTKETGQYFSFPIAVRSVAGGKPVILSVRPAP